MKKTRKEIMLMKREEDYDTIMDLLDEDDEETRTLAAEALADIVPTLLMGIGLGTDEETRSELVYTLYQIAENGQSGAIVKADGILPVIRAFRDPSDDIRANSILCLAIICENGFHKEIKSSLGIRAFKRGLHDPYWKARHNAVLGLGQMITNLRSVMPVVDAGVVPHMLGLLKDSNRDVRFWASQVTLMICRGELMDITLDPALNGAAAVKNAGGVAAIEMASKDTDEEISSILNECLEVLKAAEADSKKSEMDKYIDSMEEEFEAKMKKGPKHGG